MKTHRHYAEAIGLLSAQKQVAITELEQRLHTDDALKEELRLTCNWMGMKFPVPVPCKWSYDGQSGEWHTVCGNKYNWWESSCSPTDRKVKFCQYCGKPLEVIE